MLVGVTMEIFLVSDFTTIDAHLLVQPHVIA